MLCYQDHSYCCPSLQKMKKKLRIADKRIQYLERQLRNTCRREKKGQAQYKATYLRHEGPIPTDHTVGRHALHILWQVLLKLLDNIHGFQKGNLCCYRLYKKIHLWDTNVCTWRTPFNFLRAIELFLFIYWFIPECIYEFETF